MCPADCTCRCGDGVCVFGEWCATCPADCDCTPAATPPMGWNSWNIFGCDIDEKRIKEVADAIVQSGMRDLGYRYVNLDDCWQVARDPSGQIVADPARFPSGMKALADHVHSLGLLFGTYTCAGPLTCQGRPGSFDYEVQDAITYAAWGVDFVKEDWCSAEKMDARERYRVMHDAILKSGRPMLLSICNWGRQQPWVFGREVGTMWRTTDDIGDTFMRMLINLETNWPLAPYTGPFGYNDPDMLEVGNGGMSADEYRAHFSLWAMMAAPLIAGNDVRTMTEETRSILLNEEVIAVDQDPSVVAGVKVRAGDVELWARPLTMPGGRAVVLFNKTETPVPGGFAFEEVGLSGGEASVRDLWNHKDLGVFHDRFDAPSVPPHGVVMLLVRGAEHAPHPGVTSLLENRYKHASAHPDPVRAITSPFIAGRPYGEGLYVGAASVVIYDLGGRCVRFSAAAGIEDSAGGKGTVVFEARAAGRQVRTGVVRAGQEPVPIELDLTSARELWLVTTPAGDGEYGDRAVFLDPLLECR